jgi:formamidopyrimidine-DNA glycosylase
MPELPEVEHVARALQMIVAGRAIVKAELRRERLAPDITPRSFSKRLAGTTVNFIHRRGKHILFDLDNRLTLIVHLRMSGRFMLLTSNSTDPKFAHALFHFSDETRLVFQDQRHFGLMKLVGTPKLFETKELSKLAPEPFSDDFSIDYLRTSLKSSNREVKEFLIDQTKVCGLGNIYASEALFLAKISPSKRTQAISKAKAEALFTSIRDVLDEAIQTGGASNITHENIGEGVYGTGSETAWSVYNRENEPCPNCGSPIRRIKQAGRSTYYCVKCQR